MDIKNKMLDMCAAPGSKTGQIASMMKIRIIDCK